MSIYFHSFRIGELYDAIGSHDAKILKKLETGLLVRDPELLVCTKAIVADGLLYHDLFSDDIYNAAITHIVQLLPSHRNFFEEKDYQTDYHTSWLELPKSSLLRTFWGYLTHGRYLFDHPISPRTSIRYGFLTQEELPQFLQLVQREDERLPWYFFQHTLDAIRMTEAVGDDLFASIHIKGRRYRVISATNRRNE